MNAFDFVNSINFDKGDLFKDPQAEKDYVPFLVNRALSYFHDTVFYANEMNRYSHIDKRLQYEFLKESITKRKRFSKWSKKPVLSDDLTVVKEYYGYSTGKAIEVLGMITPQQMNAIRDQLRRGGTP